MGGPAAHVGKQARRQLDRRLSLLGLAAADGAAIEYALFERGALQGLNAGHLVDRYRAMAVIGTRLRPGKPRRCRRIWRQRQDRVSASASNESDAV